MTISTAAAVPVCPPLQDVTLSHGKLAYRFQGSGEALVFLHGLLGSSKSWAFQFAHFSRRHRVIAWDAPGFGQSDMVPVSLDAFVDALREFLVTIDAGTVDLVGHSMGGTVAARFAARHPDMVSRLVLSCSHPGYNEPDTAPMSAKFEGRMRDLKEIGREAYGLARATDLLPEPRDPAVFAFAAEVASEVNPEGLRRATRMLQLADNRPLLPTLTMPVLVLTGGIDKVVQPALKADLLRLTPFARHIDMPGVAHAPYFQSPDDFNGLIDDFLSGL
jgi:pimeloyl-ACP methyl ester carboxylesterase